MTQEDYISDANIEILLGSLGGGGGKKKDR